jgi:hypothetical protein
MSAAEINILARVVILSAIFRHSSLSARWSHVINPWPNLHCVLRGYTTIKPNFISVNAFVFIPNWNRTSIKMVRAVSVLALIFLALAPAESARTLQHTVQQAPLIQGKTLGSGFQGQFSTGVGDLIMHIEEETNPG